MPPLRAPREDVVTRTPAGGGVAAMPAVTRPAPPFRFEDLEPKPMDPFVAAAIQKIAKLDPLLIHAFARFPEAGPWVERQPLIGTLIPNVCDVVYGPMERPEGSYPWANVVTGPAGGGMADAKPLKQTTTAAGTRFYVDHDGFAMHDNRPIAMEDIPAGTTLWDERTGMEQGDVGAILWRDVGTTKRALPNGVALVACQPERRPSPSEVDQ
jgi:hypothetical protein